MLKSVPALLIVLALFLIAAMTIALGASLQASIFLCSLAVVALLGFRDWYRTSIKLTKDDPFAAHFNPMDWLEFLKEAKKPKGLPPPPADFIAIPPPALSPPTAPIELDDEEEQA